MSAIWFLLMLLPIYGSAERFNCRGRILGAYYADFKSGCRAFHVCVRVAGGGIRDFRFFCPPGTRFTQEAQTCTDWGDDDGLTCGSEYDGQFEIYKIGSGFDTKKVSNPPRDEDDFSLQRAETGDRRNQQQSDLKTAHSSDFFSGRRDRGRDDPSPQPSSIPPSTTVTRAPYRRPPPRTTAVQIQQTARPFDSVPKRKLIRKRPVYVEPSTTPKLIDYTAQATTSRTFPPQNYQTTTFKTVQPQNYPTTYRANQDYRTTAVSTPDTFYDVSKINPKNERYTTKQQPQLLSLQADRTESGGFKVTVKNNFLVSAGPNYPPESSKQIEVKPNGQTNQIYNDKSRGTTANYNNFNSVSYDTNKSQFKTYNNKENYYTNPSTTPIYTTVRTTQVPTVNPIAYKTNIAFNAASNNFANSEEDDGQYRPPEGEDDGQYRPELYEREELLSGAHSLNIVASGNRLPEDQKKSKIASSFTQTPAAPRPFSVSTTIKPHVTSTTYRSTQPTVQYTTYSTYSPAEYTTIYQSTNYSPTFGTTPRSQSRNTIQQRTSQSTFTSTQSPTHDYSPTTYYTVPKKYTPETLTNQESKTTSKAAHIKKNHKNDFNKPVKNNKEDTSYDYAYYDSDPYTEYEQIEEFSRTNKKV